MNRLDKSKVAKTASKLETKVPAIVKRKRKAVLAAKRRLRLIGQEKTKSLFFPRNSVRITLELKMAPSMV